MAINKKLIHFKTFDTFNSKKLSADENNKTYTIGVNGSVQTGNPEILYQSICYIKDTQQQWTHGQLYSCNVDASNALWVDENNVVNRDTLKIGTFELVSGEYHYMLEIQEMSHPWYSSIHNVVAEFTGNYIPNCYRDDESDAVIFDESNIGLEFQVISYDGEPDGDVPQTLFVKLPTKWDSDTTTRPLSCDEYVTNLSELHDGDKWSCANGYFTNPDGSEEDRLLASVSRQLITPYREYATHAYLNNERVAVRSDIPNDIITAPNGHVSSDDLQFSTINAEAINLENNSQFTFKAFNGSDGVAYTFNLSDGGISATAIPDWGKRYSFSIDYDGVLINGEQVATLPQVSSEFTKQITNVTYQDLVQLRNSKQLIPGAMYRITDYVCTTTLPDTASANHPFDIVVTAISNNALSEEASVVLHEGDTYFANSNLSTWKVWYTLDNDSHRFNWADEENGKGIIYRMIDEFNNDCPYDFKNIKYYHNGMSTYVHTFTWIDENYNVMDSSVFGNNGTLTFNGKIYGVHNNVIKPYYIISDIPDEHTGDYVRQQCLNNIVFISDYSYQGKGNDGFCGCNNNSFGNECYNNSFRNYCYANSFGNYCYNNSFGNYCCSNSFRNECYANTFGSNCDYNSFGNDCNYNSFGNECQYNTFGNNCDYNSFGNKCYKNSFVNNCNNNSFGNNCCYNTFGNNCYKNSFVDECYSNSFGNECYSNSFGNDCRYNSFGNDCRYNSFGNSCRNNLFGNYCYANSFVNECCSNSFGNYCYANVFGNYCCSNSFGNECYRNSFRLSASTSGTLLDYCHYNKFDDGCTYNVIWNDGTTSSGFPLQNININRGVSGTSRSYNMINIDTLNADYETKVDNVNGYIYILKGPENIYKTTYSNLISIRDNSQLIPGLQYRITDYITTTIQENTTSAGHQFDIIVTALDESILSEEAKAIQHDGDTYFNTANLSAWQLWYCLDNDDTRFGWADTTNGKGVIYRMIDENGNDCPYDFKNIVYVTECKGYAINEDIATALSNSTIDDPYFIEVDYWFVSDNAASGTYGSKGNDIIVRLEMGTNPDGEEVPVVYKTERKGIVATWDDEAQEYILDEDYTNPDYADAFYHVGRYTYNDIEYDMWRKAEMSDGEMVWLNQESGGDSHILTEILTQESAAPYQYKYTFNQVLDISSTTIDEQVLDLSTAHKRLPCDKQFQMCGNTIAPSHYDISSDTYSSATWLNANIINVTSDWNNPYVSYELYNNTFELNSWNNTITIGSGAVYIMNNYIGPNCYCNKFYGDGGEGLCDNHLEISSMCVFKLNASYNVLHQCHDVTFGEYLGSSTFSNVAYSKIGDYTYNSRISNSANISYEGYNIVINNGFNIDISTDIFCRNLSINNSGNFTLVSNADLNYIDINNLTLEDTTPKHTIVIPGTGGYPLKVAQNSRGEIKIYNEADLIA